MSDPSLDDVDRAILHHLQRDGRKTITAIAEPMDVSANTIRNRIHDMEEADVISGYMATVNYDESGVQHHYLFVCTARVSEREELAADAGELPGVTEVITLMTGTHNVYLVTAASEKDEVSELAYAVDELGLAVEREHLIRDHVRRPYSRFRPPEHVG